MEENSLKELVLNIVYEIKERNSRIDIQSIPQSDDFFQKLIKSHNLIPYTVPKLMRILINSNMVFAFDIVKADRKNKIGQVEGFVITNGGVIKSLKDFYGNELSRQYTLEFNKKLSADKVLSQLSPFVDDYNNTPIGKMLNISICLLRIESILENNILNYSKEKLEKKLDEELASIESISVFINEPAREKATIVSSDEAESKEVDKNRRAVDSSQHADFLSHLKKYSIEKTLMVYGIEFYTRVCFRENRFFLIQKIIDDDIVTKKKDLLNIKKLIQMVRANSDQDMTLQNYASEINMLQKSINNKLKD